MGYELQDQDYLELWKHFQERVASVKGAMFNTITWILGFAAGLLGFMLVKFTEVYPSKAFEGLWVLLIIGSVVGLAICGYAYIALGESVKHITINFAYADRCLGEIEKLRSIIMSQEALKMDDSTKKIAKQLHWGVSLFAAAFVLILVGGVAIFFLP